MVHLFNISIENNIASCDYTPETSDKVGHVVVDLKTEEVSRVDYSEYEFGKGMYVAHVRSKLLELFKSSEAVPKETTAIWY